MDWRQAQRETLEKWSRIHAEIGDADSIEQITELNAVCPICDKARETVAEASERCAYCVVFGDPESCKEVRFRISVALLDGDLPAARSLVEEVIERVRGAELPVGGDHRAGG